MIQMRRPRPKSGHDLTKWRKYLFLPPTAIGPNGLRRLARRCGYAVGAGCGRNNLTFALSPLVAMSHSQANTA